jgi:glycosyltransferase involved in cell wall biosynthesis
MIEEGITGFFIPLNDVETSANILAALLPQKLRLQEAGKRGRKRVAALFSQTAFRENWLRLVQG